MSSRALLISALCAALPVVAFAATDSPSALETVSSQPAAGIMDNSFLIEEAYNQEAGVVQHILNVVHTVTRHAGADERDLAFAPRSSLILPTGDETKGLGNGTVGYQINLPVSKIVSDRWTLHGNAGATFFPGVSGHDLVSYNLGASAIYAVSANINLMLESVANFDQGMNDFDRTERTVSAVISPGVRYAFNHPGDAQTVIGIAVPIGLTSAAPDYGVFLYASFEHFFFRPKTRGAGK